MSLCRECGWLLEPDETFCPQCGESVLEETGVFQASCVMIFDSHGEQCYSSVDQVPVAARKQLLRSTGSENSATIVIADQRGREEIANALRALPPSGRGGFWGRRIASRRGAKHSTLLWLREHALTPFLVLLLAVLATVLVYQHR
jgi:hypothetical protein